MLDIQRNEKQQKRREILSSNRLEEIIPYNLVLENHIKIHKWFHNNLSFWGYERKRNYIEKDPGEKEIKKDKKKRKEIHKNQ